ncbi:MAG: hypothetical protein J6Y42_04135 [Bacilli bacterium]|nr:hypothetical protein [Bacilli bacterium]
MNQEAYFEECIRREEYQIKVQRVIDKYIEKYEKKYKETPFYQNTSNCVLEGIIDELKSIDVTKIDYEGVGCYFGGRIEVLEELKEELIFCKNVGD